MMVTGQYIQDPYPPGQLHLYDGCDANTPVATTYATLCRYPYPWIISAGSITTVKNLAPQVKSSLLLLCLNASAFDRVCSSYLSAAARKKLYQATLYFSFHCQSHALISILDYRLHVCDTHHTPHPYPKALEAQCYSFQLRREARDGIERLLIKTGFRSIHTMPLIYVVPCHQCYPSIVNSSPISSMDGIRKREIGK